MNTLKIIGPEPDMPEDGYEVWLVSKRGNLLGSCIGQGMTPAEALKEAHTEALKIARLVYEMRLKETP